MKKTVLLIILLGVAISSEVPVSCAYGEAVKLKLVSDRGLDTDGDGLFEYLEIKLEANISSYGIYILESSNLLDRSGNTISATAYQELSLDVGEHVLTVLLDGRLIHSLGLNPVNISYIGLISDDYTIGDFLNNVPLSREYAFNEFEPLPDYEIGVKEGDWVRYQVTILLSPSGSSVEEAVNFQYEILVKVDTIEWPKVSLEIVYSEDDYQSEVITGYLEMESQIFPFLMPVGMSIGDSISLLTDATINSTRIGNVLGGDREINNFQTRDSVSQADDTIIQEQNYFWDKETGILVTAWVNRTTFDLSIGKKSYYNVSFSIDSTTVIPQETSILLGSPSEIKLGETVNVTAVLLDFHGNGIDGGQVVLKSVSDTEIGEGMTDSLGHVTFEYKPKKPGEQKIKTVFAGTEEFLPSENSASLVVRGNPFARYLPWIAALLIIIVVILLFYMRDKFT